MLRISLKKNVGFLKKKKFIYLLQKFKHLYFKTTTDSFFFDNNSVFQLEIKQKKINKNLLNFILLSDRLLLSSYLKFFIRTKGKIFLRKDCIFVINILNSLRFSSKLRYLSKFLRFRSMVYFFVKNKQKCIERSVFSVFKSKKKTSGSFYRYKLASKNILKLTINQLVLSNVYIGANTDFYNLALKPFLLQIESNFVIFNLKYTYLSLKLLVSFVIKIFSYRQKILIVNNSDFFRFTFLLKYKNIMYYDKKWIGGALTNYRVVRKCENFAEKNFSQNSIRLLSVMPSLVFLFNSNNSRWALFECFSLRIPIFSIVNTDSMFFESVNYWIPGNTESFESAYTYLSVLKNAIKYGLKTEKIKVLKIRKKNKKNKLSLKK